MKSRSKKLDWKKCKHEWGKREEIKDANFGVVFGLIATCNICGARWHDDWTAMRAGSIERIYPPKED